ncbi:hypothetical protein, partial [Pontimicrobium sp. MEBiC01747]
SNSDKIIGFILTDGFGNKYKFLSTESSYTVGGAFAFCQSPSQNFISAWHLTEISNYDDSRKIFFEYENYILQDYEIYRSTMNRHRISIGGECNNRPLYETVFNGSAVNYNGLRLKRIYNNIDLSEVNFIPGSLRTDLNGIDLFTLKDIVINNGYSDVDKYTLTHDYSTERLTLNSIAKGLNNASSLKTKFYYWGSLPNRDSKEKDHWGYKNINPTYDLFEPYQVTYQGGNTSTFGNGNRSPDFEGSKSGVLYKIEHPTGGYDLYTFEPHDYSYIGSNLINEYEINPVSLNVESFGTSGQGCTSVNTDIQTGTFTINPNPNDLDPNNPTEIFVQIFGQVTKYTENYFSAGLSPKVEILDSNGAIVYGITVSGGAQLTNTVYETIGLLPGDYTVKTYATWRSCDHPNLRDEAKILLSYDNFSSNLLLKKQAGGVRVKTIEKYITATDKVLELNYTYEMSNGYSSGIIHKEPRYTYDTEVWSWVSIGGSLGGADNSCQYVIALDNDVVNNGITGGGHIGYKKVTITQNNGDNGVTEENFSTGTNFIYDTPPFAPPIDNSHLARPLSIIQKNKNNVEVQSVEYDYESTENFTNSFRVSSKGGTSIGGNWEHKFDKGLYRILIGHTKIKSKIETLKHIASEDLINETHYTYDSQLHKEKEIKRISSIDGKEYIQKNYFPEDIQTLSGFSTSEINTVNTLSSQYRYNIPIQTENYIRKNGELQLLNTNRSVYKLDNSKLDLEKVKNAKGVNSLEERLIYHKYDELSNLLEISKTNDKHTVYIWGYHKQYPIAKIENATYTDVSSLVNNIQTLSNADNDRTILYAGNEGALRQALNNLRNEPSLLNSIITTYTYDPLIGITSITDPKGVTVYYEYDIFNRLKYIKDQDGNIVSKNEYNYKQN